MSLSAEEVRKLKARVDELEKVRSSLLHYEKMERSSQDAVQGAAPRTGPDVGKSGLDGYSQEDLWQYVWAKLIAEQENGECITGKGQQLPVPAPMCGVVLIQGTLKLPSSSRLASPGSERRSVL